MRRDEPQWRFSVFARRRNGPARARLDRRNHSSPSDNAPGHPSAAASPALADRFGDLACAVLAGDLTTDEADRIERLVERFALVDFLSSYKAH
ncbi:hypothetical protein [Rhodoblastus sp.]|uniref:hypothetical protein n=1 Tax=Rhodoblastus sp. TaxID=1962975 RepID=UPI003F98816D